MTTRIEGGGEKILLTLAIEAVEMSPATGTGWLVRVNALMDGWMGSSQTAEEEGGIQTLAIDPLIQWMRSCDKPLPNLKERRCSSLAVVSERGFTPLGRQHRAEATFFFFFVPFSFSASNHMRSICVVDCGWEEGGQPPIYSDGGPWLRDGPARHASVRSGLESAKRPCASSLQRSVWPIFFDRCSYGV